MEKKDFADTLWKYFELHSNQRIQMMNFYLISITLFFTGLVTLMSSNKDMKIYETGICVAIIFVTWIFYNLDKRTKYMIKRCENAIKSLEIAYTQDFGSEIMIFTIDENEKGAKELSYSDLFFLLYLFIVILAVLCLILIM